MSCTQKSKTQPGGWTIINNGEVASMYGCMHVLDSGPFSFPTVRYACAHAQVGQSVASQGGSFRRCYLFITLAPLL